VCCIPLMFFWVTPDLALKMVSEDKSMVAQFGWRHILGSLHTMAFLLWHVMKCNSIPYMQQLTLVRFGMPCSSRVVHLCTSTVRPAAAAVLCDSCPSRLVCHPSRSRTAGRGAAASPG
jgi:hypothetical protein